MAPIVNNQSENEFNEFIFTLENTNVSVANAIRRTLLSDIPLLVFKTFPYEKNRVEFIANTTRFNNEIIKQRLSAIPVYIKDVENFPFEEYEFSIDKVNNTSNIDYVTTGDFVIKDTKNNKILDKSETINIFPKNPLTNYFIDIVRLRPKLSENMKGEELKIKGKLHIGTAKEDSNYNAVSTAAYSYTPDPIKINEIWETEIYPSIKNDLSKDEIDKYKSNWLLLEAKRYYKENSFDFKIKSSCVFNNKELIIISCDLLIKQLGQYIELINEQKIKIINSDNTLNNCFDVILENTGYTIGKLIEYFMYSKFYEDNELLSFCGFKKEHPHYSDSILRIAFKEETLKELIYTYLKDCCILSIEEIKQIQNQFR